MTRMMTWIFLEKDGGCNVCDIDRYPAICQQLAKGTDEEWELRLFIEAAITNYIWLETLREQKIDFWKYESTIKCKIRTRKH